jgi:hypothetical protein
MKLGAALCLLFLSSCGGATKTIPGPAAPCTVPAFHPQTECDDNLDCLLGEFALTLEREAEVEAALMRCGNVRRN